MPVLVASAMGDYYTLETTVVCDIEIKIRMKIGDGLHDDQPRNRAAPSLHSTKSQGQYHINSLHHVHEAKSGQSQLHNHIMHMVVLHRPETTRDFSSTAT